MKKAFFLFLIIVNLCACVKPNKTQDSSISQTISVYGEKHINSSEGLNLQKPPNDEAINAGEVKYINSPEGLNLRKSPRSGSEAILTIPNGSAVNIISIDSASIVIDGIKDNWYFVNYGNITGWVFGGYLTNVTSTQIGQEAELAKSTIAEEKINDPYDKFLQNEAGVVLTNGDKYFIGQAVDGDFISKSNTVVETSLFGPYFGPINGFEDENVKVAWNNQGRILYIEILSSAVKTYSDLTLGDAKNDVINSLGIAHFETSNMLRYDNFWDDVWGIIFQFENNIATKIILFCYT